MTRNGPQGHGFECRPLNWLSFFAENPFPATLGPEEAQEIPKIAPNIFQMFKDSLQKICLCVLFSPNCRRDPGKPAPARPEAVLCPGARALPQSPMDSFGNARETIGRKNKTHKHNFWGEQSQIFETCRGDFRELSGPRGGRKRIPRDK